MEIKGILALSGKEWVCYLNSTEKEIKRMNPTLTEIEVQQVYNQIRPISEDEEYARDNN